MSAIRRAKAATSSSLATPVRCKPTSKSTKTLRGLEIPVAAAAAAKSSTLTALSETTINSSVAPWSVMRRLILAAVVVGEVIRTPGKPAPTMVSASRRVAQQMPTAPASIWR